LEKEPKQFGELDAKNYIPGAEVLLRQDNDNVRRNKALSDHFNNLHGFCFKEEKSESDSAWEDEDDEDESSDGGEDWVNVSHSEDEEEENDGESKGGVTLDPAVRKGLAAMVTESRILTDEDFKKIETLQLQKEVLSARKGSAKKRKATDSPYASTTV